MHPACWEFEVDDAAVTQAVQRMLVLGPKDINLRAWPAAAAGSTRRGCVFAAATPAAYDEGIHTQASVPQATPNALGKAVSSPHAAEAAPRSGSTHSGNTEADPGSHVHGDVASTAQQGAAALHSQAALREEVGVVPTVAVGDVFFATSSAELLKSWLFSDESAGSDGTAAQLRGDVQQAAESPSEMQVALYTSEDAALLRPSQQVRRALANRDAVRRAEAAAAGRSSSPSRPWWRPWQHARRQDECPDVGTRTKPAAAEAALQQRQMTRDISALEERKSLSAMSWGMALTVALEKCAGRALLQPDPVQVWEARRLLRAGVAADALPPTLRGLPVFMVPGVSLTVPTHRGEVRFTPLFLSRRQLDDTVSAVQDIVACSWRVKRRRDRQAFRMTTEAVAAHFTGLQGSSGPGQPDSQGDDAVQEVGDFLQEMGLVSSPSNSGSSIGGQPSGFGAGISRFAVGTLSLWLRAHEAGANAVDSAISCLDIDARLAGLRRRPVVVPHSLRDYVTACGRRNNSKQPGKAAWSRPWTQQDIDRLDAPINLTANVALHVVEELQKQGVSLGYQFGAAGFAATAQTESTTFEMQDFSAMHVDSDRAFGKGARKDKEEALVEEQQPNSGIILIGDSKEWSSSNDVEVQLPGGRKAKLPNIGTVDGNVLCCTG